MIRYAVRVLALVVGLALELVVAYVTLDHLFPVAERFAESGMGVRAPLDGVGGGVLYAAAVLAAFVATSAVAALGAGRERIVRACRTTAILVTCSGIFVLVPFIPSALFSSYDAAKIHAELYVKYPPFRAAEDLRDNALPLGALALLVDMVLTIAIVIGRKRPPEVPPLSAADTSPAAT